MTAGEELLQQRRLIEALAQLYFDRGQPALRDAVATCIVAVIRDGDGDPELWETTSEALAAHIAAPSPDSARMVANQVLADR